MLQRGTMISTRYQVLGLLGQGGMSNIYVCQDTRLRGKTWVVKEMTARYSDPQEQATALKYFEQEAHLLANLQHPNLPTVNDYFQSGGKYYLVMEHIEGEDLGRMLSRVSGPLPERQVCEWGVQIATVLFYLHCQKPNPIIFRDVKPSNIMITGAVVKLIDFGIARHFNPSKKGDTMRIGSPGYAPPEQYAGQTDPRSDIYALGVTLHQALTGRDPTTTQTPFIIPPARTLNPQVSEEMAAILDRSTRIHPEERYQSMLEMKKDLQALAARHRGGTTVVRATPAGATTPHPGPGATGPTPGSAATPPPSPSRRRLTGSRAAAALALLISLGLGLVTLSRALPEASLGGLWRELLFRAAQAPAGSAGVRLYLEGAPGQLALRQLSRELREAPTDPTLRIAWSNALAGLTHPKPWVIGALYPAPSPTPAGAPAPPVDPTLRGLATAQAALNDLGGVQARPIVLVLQPYRPGRLARALSEVALGQAGRRTSPQEPRPGQQAEALIVFGPADELAPLADSAPPLPGLLLSEGGQDPSDPGGDAWRRLPAPSRAGWAPRLVELARGRTLAVTDPGLGRQIGQAGGGTRTIQLPGPSGGPTDLPEGSLLVLEAGDLGPAAAQGWLASPPRETLLLADTPEDLPSFKPKGEAPALRAWVQRSPFHPWEAGAGLSRLDPDPTAPPEAAARAYDGLRWLAEVRLGGSPRYRGATLERGPGGSPQPAPPQIYKATPEGWRHEATPEGWRHEATPEGWPDPPAQEASSS